MEESHATPRLLLPMKTEWTRKNLTIAGSGVVAALLVLPNLGKGIDAVVYLAQTPAVAYAAKQTAEQVDDHFQRYLEKQEAVANALNAYVAQQQQQQQRRPPVPDTDEPTIPPLIWIEPDMVEGKQVCSDGEQRWWWQPGEWNWSDLRGCE